MVRHANENQQGASPVAAALAAGFERVQLSWMLDELRLLARQENALALRLAMVLACIKQLDLSVLGYSGFLPFCRERVQWGQAWVRAMVRLVESPLHRVKAAAAAGHLPLRLAVNAPGRISVEEQDTWLGEVLLGNASPDPVSGQAPKRRAWSGPDAEIIRQARELARVCMGRPARLTELDAYILRHWREHVPGAALEEGRATPPAPEAQALDFDWVDEAPAEGLLGPWEEPADLDEALAQLEAVEAVRRGRVATLARVFAMVHHYALWCHGDFDSPWDFAQRVFGWSRRTAQRYRKLGWSLDWFPELDQAVREGFSPEGASAIGWLSDRAPECRRWLDVARHLGEQELKRATACWGRRLGDYERALHIARRNAAELLGPHGPGSHPSGTVPAFHIGCSGPLGACSQACEEGARDTVPSAGTRAWAAGPCAAIQGSAVAPVAGTCGSEVAMSCAGTSGSAGVTPGAGTPGSGGATPGAGTPGSGGSAPGAGTPGSGSAPCAGAGVEIRVALPTPEPQRVDSVRGHADLAEAARWFVAHNALPRGSGFTAVKQRARFRCENPECGRSSLRLEAHHVHWQRYGGSDHPENAVALCRCCHLRGVHTADERIRVSRVIVEGMEALFWEYPGRAPVLQFREVPPRHT